MSCRFPHYVYYTPVNDPKIFIANAEDAEEAIRDLRREHGEYVVVHTVKTTPPDSDEWYDPASTGRES